MIYFSCPWKYSEEEEHIEASKIKIEIQDAVEQKSRIYPERHTTNDAMKIEIQMKCTEEASMI